MNKDDDWEQFKQIFTDLGNPVDINWISKYGDVLFPLYNSAALMCRFVENCELEPSKRIIFGLTDSMKIRAAASVKNDKGFVGISVGSSFILLYTFASIFCDKTMFPEIGHSSLENEREKFPFVPLEASHINPNMWHIPNCPIRMRASVEMAKLAFTFLVAHEITHIEQGHLGLLKELEQIDSLVENPSKKNSSTQLIKQSLELLADFHGATRILRKSVQMRLENNYEQLKGSHNRRALRALYQNPKATYYFVMFSINVAWRIYDVQFWNELELQELSHPPVPARQLALNMNIAEHIKKNNIFGVSEKEAEDIATKAFVHAHAAYLKITDQPNNEEATLGLKKLLDDGKSQPHLYNLMMSLDEISEKLKSHAWGWPGVQIPPMTQ